MGTYIIKIKDLYFEWSSIVDAPVSNGMTLEEFMRYYRRTYGEAGMVTLPDRLSRVEKTGHSGYDWSIETIANYNRAGENEEQLTLDEIYYRYKA